MKERLIIFILNTAAKLPYPAISLLGYLTGSLFYYVPNKAKTIAAINIKKCYPELSPKARATLLKKSLRSTVITGLEIPNMWLGDIHQWLKRIKHGESEQKIDQKLALGRGLLIASPHLGNWELGLHFLQTKAPVTALYRPPRQKVIGQFMYSGRDKTGATMVPISISGIRSIYQALKRGEIVIILPDQQPKEKTGGAAVFADFFKQPALTMTLVGRIAQKTKCPILFGFVYRLPRLQGFSSDWIEGTVDIENKDPIISATAVNLGIEKSIQVCPEQYQWTYKRFEMQPDGVNPYKSKP